MIRASVATRALTLVGCETMMHAADFAKFPCDKETTDWRFQVRYTESIAPPPHAVQKRRVWQAIAEDGRHVVIAKDGSFSLTFDDIYSRVDLILKTGFCHADIYHYVYAAHTFGYHLLGTGGGLVHSAGFRRGGKGIVLAGASGVGKSTMLYRVMAADPSVAPLCEDMVAVMPECGGFRAYGTPFCGEDTLCENDNVPLTAIVLLEKSTQNRWRRASFSEAMFGLNRSVLSPAYTPLLGEKAVDLAVQLINAVPVFIWENDGSKEAGEALLAALDKGELTL